MLSLVPALNNIHTHILFHGALSRGVVIDDILKRSAQANSNSASPSDEDNAALREKVSRLEVALEEQQSRIDELQASTSWY